MWHLLLSLDGSNLVECVYGGAEAAVDAEDFVVNNGSKSQVVENIGAVPPYIYGSELSKTFIVKAIDLRDLSTLVITTY